MRSWVNKLYALLLAESSRKMIKNTFVQHGHSLMIKQSIIIYNTIKELDQNKTILNEWDP